MQTDPERWQMDTVPGAEPGHGWRGLYHGQTGILSGRYCTLYHINEVGDEFHYVSSCHFFANQIMLLLGKRIYTHLSIFTFNHVMNASGTKLLKLSKLKKIIAKNVNGLKKWNNLLYAFLVNKL